MIHQSTTAGEPIISVIMPAYNCEHLIDETFESLQAQTLVKWECIVVDDGSTDQTVRVLQSAAVRDSRIRYFRQRNGRQASARNRALKYCRGRYVQFLDADDLIEPGKFEQQVAYLETHPEVDIVYGDVRYFHHGSTELRFSADEDDKPWLPQVSGSGEEMLAALIERNITVVDAPLLRRSVIESVGEFDVNLTPAEDWDYWVRCAGAGKRFEYQPLPGTLTMVRLHSDSSSRNQMRMMRACLSVRKKSNRLIRDSDLRRINRELTGFVETEIRSIALRGAFDAVKRDDWKGALSGFASIAMDCGTLKEKAKWLFCGLVAPLAPKDDFASVITDPVGKSMLRILRSHLQGASSNSS